MKTAPYALVMSLALSTSLQAAEVDYSACADHVNPEVISYANPGASTPKPGIENFMPANYMPFRLNEDGSLEVFEDSVISHTKGNPEVIEYEVPDYFNQNYMGNTEGNPFKQKLRKVKIFVHRGPQGSISIKTDMNYTQAELDKLTKAMTPPAPLANLGESVGDDQAEGETAPPQVAGGMIGPGMGMGAVLPKGVEFNLGVKNGKCYPARMASTTILNHKSGETQQRVISDTQLCRDIAQEFKKKPELSKCFDPEINKGLTNIFKDYFEREPFITPHAQFNGKEWQTPRSEVPYFPPNGNFGTTDGGIFGEGMSAGFGGGGINDMYLNTTHALLFPHIDAYKMGKTPMDKAGISKYFGTSPSITAAHYLETCRHKGLGKFIDDDSYWVEKAPPADEAQKQDGEAKR